MHTDARLARLLQLVSPSLPIGGYSYSQGIEWAVEQGWITDQPGLHDWLAGIMQQSMLYLDVPLLLRLYAAWQHNDVAELKRWNAFLIASRESAELRLEESNRARAFCRLLIDLDQSSEKYRSLLEQTQLCGFAYASQRWGLAPPQACYGYLWSWLENLVLAGIKIIPLGQTAGQQLLFSLSESIPQVISDAGGLSDRELGATATAVAIASARHETQYSRLFRS